LARRRPIEHRHELVQRRAVVGRNRLVTAKISGSAAYTVREVLSTPLRNDAA
jgi:hypothetical protein